MFLEQFTKTELQRKIPHVFKKAEVEPVVITERGKDAFIIMTKEKFISLTDNKK